MYDVLSIPFRKQNESKGTLLSKSVILKTFDINTIYALLNNSITLYPRKGAYVYRPGDPAKYIYFVFAGELEIVSSIKKKEYLPKSPKDNFPENVFEREHKRQLQTTEEIALLTIYPHDYFGDESGFHAQVMRFGVRVYSSESTIFLIEKSRIISNVNNLEHLEEIARLGAKRLANFERIYKFLLKMKTQHIYSSQEALRRRKKPSEQFTEIKNRLQAFQRRSSPEERLIREQKWPKDLDLPPITFSGFRFANKSQRTLNQGSDTARKKKKIVILERSHEAKFLTSPRDGLRKRTSQSRRLLKILSSKMQDVWGEGARYFAKRARSID